MDYSFAVAIGLHSLAAVIWVGGMFFAHFVLRPSVAEMNESLRLALWRRVLPRFFVWAALSVVVLITTGYGVLLTGYRGGILGGNLHIDIMQGTGAVMLLVFVYLVLGPFGSLKRALERNDMGAAAKAHASIRHLITINLTLGVVTTFIGAFGTYVGY